MFCDECGCRLILPSGQTPKEISFNEKIEKIQKYLPKGLTAKILSQKDRIEGERKQVTVMFCDMENFTPLSESLGIEEAYSIMDQVYEILIHKVHDYEGTVNEMTGDGIMALFGAPVALEDAPQRAVRSSLAIHREMAKFNDRLKEEKRDARPVKMRIGIHTGPVVVGTVGNDLRVEFKAVGDTVNLASRMEGQAQPGTTYVTEDTFKLTEGLFRFEGLGQRMIKGKEKPIHIYRVIAPSTRRTRFDVSAERGLTPFVGRERELELLLDGFERAKSGRGQAFSIMGEAGVGKSRLLYEFRKAIASVDVAFIEGRCLSYSRNVAYHPVIDTLKSSFDIQDDDGEAEIKDKVKRGLETVGLDEATVLPYFLELLSVKESGIDDLSLSPQARKARTIEALNRNVLKGSELRPVVIAVEDLHWIDKSSEERFKSLLESISGARVFLIFTYRPDFVHTWGGRSYHSQVNLNRLSNPESLAMVAHLLKTEGIDRDLEELILEKTEGVPFFIEEFIPSLQELKIIEKKNDRYQLARLIQDLPIPSTIHDVIMARVDALPEEVKKVLQIGSVIGREFSYDLIMKVIGLPEVELLSNLSALKDSELLYERGIFPQSTYIFKHALTHDVVYDSILTKSRKQIHEEVGKAIENLYAERLEEFYEMLALHYAEAGRNKKAIGYCQRAGNRAAERLAYQEAISHFTTGLALLQTLPETLARQQQELPLQTALGAALLMVRGHATPEVEAAFMRARILCQKLGDTQDILPVLFGLWRFYVMRADYEIARQLGEDLLGLSERSDELPLRVIPHYAAGFTCFCLGELLPACSHLKEGIAHYDPAQRSLPVFRAGQDPGVACRIYAAFPLWLMGYPDQALDHAHNGLTLATEIADPFSRAFALVCVSMVEQLRRERKGVYDYADAAVSLSTEKGFPTWLAAGKTFRGWALTIVGQREEGMIQLRQGIADWRAIGTELFVPYMLTLLAEGYGIVHKVDAALDALKQGLEAMERTGENWWKAEMHRLKGDLLLRQSNSDVAQSTNCFRQALDVARNQRAKCQELRAANSLARLYLSQDKRQEAYDLLAPVYDWFTEGFDTADLQEAKALLTELEN
jgi:class 3 adenylate cyclase/predicted ATPase